MKVSTTKLFDASQLGQDEQAKLAPLIDYINTSISELVKAVSGNLSFGDNVNCEIKSASLKHDVVAVIATQKAASSILAVVPLRTISESNAILSFVYSVNGKSQLTVTPQFKLSSSPSALEVKLLILYS